MYPPSLIQSWNPSGKAREVSIKLQNLVHFHAPFFTNHVYLTPHDRPPLLKGHHLGWPLYRGSTQSWKFPRVCRSEDDNFGGGPGTFCWFFFNFMFVICDSRHEDLQLFWLSFKHWFHCINILSGFSRNARKTKKCDRQTDRQAHSYPPLPPTPQLRCKGQLTTAGCHSNAVQYIIILDTLQSQRRNINHTLNSQKTPHISSSLVSYGVSIVGIWGENIDYVTTALQQHRNAVCLRTETWASLKDCSLFS